MDLSKFENLVNRLESAVSQLEKNKKAPHVSKV